MFNKNHIFQAIPVVLTATLGVVLVWVLGTSNTAFSDTVDYLDAAKSLVTNGTYPDVGALYIFRPPLYPFFIAGIWSVFPGSIVAIKVAQVLLNSGTCWIIFKSISLVGRSRGAAFAGAMLFAVNPFFLFNSAALQTECLHTFLIVLAVFLMIRLTVAGQLNLYIAAATGLVVGLASLCRPSALGIGFFLAVALLVITFRQVNSLKTFAFIIGGMFAAILPWSFYCLETKGEFFLINDGGGYNLWSGNHPEALKVFEGNFESSAAAMAYEEYIGKTLAQRQVEEWDATTGYSNLSLKQREAMWQSKALENMRANPMITAKLFAWKFYNLWKPVLNGNVYSAMTTWLSAAFLVSLYIFGFRGILDLNNGEQSVKVVYLFAAMAAAVTAIHVAIISSLRMRLPYIDPFLTIFAGVGSYGLAGRLSRKLGLERLGQNSFFRSDSSLVSA